MPNLTTFKMPDNIILSIYGVPYKSALKFWKENTTEPCPAIFDVSNNESIYIQDVDFKAPDTVILTKEPLKYSLFTGKKQGTNDQATTPVVAIVNNQSDFGLGTCNFKGMEKATNINALPAFGFIYQENFNVKGIGLMSFNANWSGAGIYFGTENCRMDTGDQSQYAITETQMKVKFSNDVNGFNLPQGDWYPVLEFDKPNIEWPEREAYTSRSSILQINGLNSDLFTFIMPNELQIQTYLQQINGFKADVTINHETNYKKLLSGNIPKVGDVITLQREYATNLYVEEMSDYVLPDMTKSRYDCGTWGAAMRSHISWSSIEGKHGNDLTGTFEGGYYLQAGDIIEDKATGKQHLIKAISRGYYSDGYPERPAKQSGYCMEYQPFKSKAECKEAGFSSHPDVFVYQNYVLDPPLEIPTTPTAQNSLVSFRVIKSRAAYLLDGAELDSTMKWKNNGFWRNIKQDEIIPASSSVAAHSFYNQRELNHDHRNSDFTGTYYRENNMNYSTVGGEMFPIIDPDTGEGMTVRALNAYAWFGSQHVNCKVPGGQYGGGYDKMFPQRDKILRSQGVIEEFKAMQRNIGEVNQGQKVVDPYFTKTKLRPRPQRLLDFLKENRR